MTRQELINEIFSKKTFLCVGLDTDTKKIPQHLLKEDDPIFAFNKQIIDATAPYCGQFKLLWLLQLRLLHAFCVFCHGQGIDHVLNVAVQETLQVVGGVAYAMVGNTSLWKVVCADLG